MPTDSSKFDLAAYRAWIFEAESKVEDAKADRRRVDLDIGSAFKSERRRRSIPLHQFAKDLKFSVPYVSDLENGKRVWTVEKLELFSQALGSAETAEGEAEEETWV